jgi:hypothetical protein
MHRPRGAAPWLLLLFSTLVHAAAAQQLDEPLRTGSAAHVEAAYLINFLRFSEWPATQLGTADAPLVVSVVGSDDAVEVVREVVAAAGPVAGRRVLVRDVDYRARRDRDSRLQRRALEQLRASHLVFVDQSAADEAEGVVHDLLGLPVLTVSNVEGFVAAGGMLELLPAGRNIVFAASPEAIQRAGLVLSAKVLKLARHVEGMP